MRTAPALLLLGTLCGCEALWGGFQKPRPTEPDAAATPADGGVEDGGARPDLAFTGPVLRRPSKSSTIALSEDDATVVMSVPEAGLVAAFNVQTSTKLAQVPTGKEPYAVVIHPDNQTAFVSNRGDATVVRVRGVHTMTPTVAGSVAVGAEPTGLALSPTGAKLFVAEWAEGRVAVIDTATLKVIGSVAVQSPRALAVTNNKDKDDDDELLLVPQFYGVADPGMEAKDNGRRGQVRVFSVRDLQDQGTISFDPLTATEAGFGVGTAPNQLGALAVRGRMLFVTSVSASPQAPVRFDNNVNPVVYVGDLLTKREVKIDGRGTLNLAVEVNKLAEPRLFLADLRDIDFVPDTLVAYALSQGADVVQRVKYNDDGSLAEFGSTQNKQIDLNTGPCAGSSGIVVANVAKRAFVNCWATRRLAVLDLNAQQLDRTVEAAPIDAAEQQVARGRRLFFTARGRWSQSAWSSCGSCHPDGLSDNITWQFPAGPRQSTSLDGSFSHGGGAQKQRIFNWTAIFDEVHDFEGNTRGVSGGKGAITSAPTQVDCGDLAKETQVNLAAGLGSPTSKELQDQAGVRCTKDWDDIEAYLKSIRPPLGRRTLDPTAVASGARLFTGDGGCARCHGGSGWTVSRRFYTPSTTTNTKLADMRAFTRPADWPAAYSAYGGGFQIMAQPTSVETAPFNSSAIGPLQLACAIRSVGTFGVPGDTTATDALEVKSAGVSPANRAQGRGGYNPPSLYGLGLGAPYLHHGQARTLEELFTDARWRTHWQAGSANFLEGAGAAKDRADLIAFLLSIDASTAEVAVPGTFAGGCQE